MRIIRLACAMSVIMSGLATTGMSETVTQDRFLEQLKQTHPLLAKEKLTPRIQEAEQSGLLGTQDWQVHSSMTYAHEEPAIAFSGPEKTDALSLSGGVERLFWNTGGTLSASFSSGYAGLSADPFLGIPGSYFQNQLAVAYTHPLLRNKNGKLDRLAYELKQFDVDLADIIAIENQEDFLGQSASRFLDWVGLYAQQQIITERVRLSEEELANTREKRDANLIDEVDVIRAADAVRIARQNLLLVQSQLQAIQAELAVLTQDNTYRELTPAFDLYYIDSLPDYTEAATRLKAESRLLTTLAIQLDRLAAARSGYANLAKPDLSLVARVGLQNAEQAYSRSWVMDKPDARIGLRLGFPLENRTAKAKIARADLQAEQLERHLEERTLELTSVLANLLTQAMQLRDVLALNQEQIESAALKTAEELKLYNQGRGQLTFVIQSRDSEQAARLTYAANALTYQKLLLHYRALMDQLFQ